MNRTITKPKLSNMTKQKKTFNKTGRLGNLVLLAVGDRAMRQGFNGPVNEKNLDQ